jgi:hypothetical protein
MAVLHSIKAQLYDNVLTENPNGFIARVASEESRNAILEKVLTVA